MGNIFVNSTSINQDFMNNVIQKSSQVCTQTAVQNANGNFVSIVGSTIGGNVIGVNQVLQTDATCMLTSQMGANINSILDAMVNQENKSTTDLFNDFTIGTGINVFKLKQSTVNNVTQINSALCNQVEIQSANSNYIYLASSRVNGNFIGVNQESDAKMQCVMNNTMNMVSYNQETSKSGQGNTTMGIFAWLFLILGGLLGLVVIGFLGLLLIGGLGATVVGGVSAANKSKELPTEDLVY